MKKIVDINGFTVEYKEGQIIAITAAGGRKIRLGQTITANGRFGGKKGIKGIVEVICEPYSGGRTSDVIDVQFSGDEELTHMKFKDISK